MTINPNTISGNMLRKVLFEPSSIALIGASDDPNKTSGRPLNYLRRVGYKGSIYPINPKRNEVQGEKAWPSLQSLPCVPEHAYILTPTATVIDSVQECADAGVKVVTILAAGFSESGQSGVEQEERLKHIATTTGIRILGPSSIGIVNLHNNLVLTANAAFAEPNMPIGDILVASHSGSMLGALLSRGKAHKMGFHSLISVGNEVDLSLGEICASTLDDPHIKGYLLFLESLREANALRDFALKAHQKNKPVYAYKLGKSQAAAEMSVTHTGALAGEDDIADTFLTDAGIYRVDMLETLFEVFPLIQKTLHVKEKKRIGIVTTTGGGAAMLVDQLGIKDLIIQEASEQTTQKFKAANIPGTVGRVIDLTLAGTNYEVMKTTINIMQEAEEFDLIAVVVGSSARFQPELAVAPIIDSHSTQGKPLVCMLVPEAPEAYQRLATAKIPCFKTPETCADAISAISKHKAPRSLNAKIMPSDYSLQAINEDAAYTIFKELQIPFAPYIVDDLLAPQYDLPFDYPVVAKICSSGIQHKTDIGGVILYLQNQQELQAAYQQITDNLKKNHMDVQQNHHVLVQAQKSGLTEVLLGYRVDPQVGPIIMLAAGGIWAEVLQDRSVRMAPVTEDIAWEMINEVRLLQTVSGLRGTKQGDLAALAKAIVKLSTLASHPSLQVYEAEINPLFVMPEGEGVMAVDALAVTYH